ncbi:sphingomyelin phosphodiesterase 5-like [Sceloporus undulatus]|uniref:sphingomyelin phosphodiesterase 5-like n=1 Tax=Sceloporus undulatus TaxID=8520 RepID=UPI001C4A8D3D|nr:sphingomyelin phosphodiesterase 5-like [Sceloporus undulatus]XP_042321758.1 sphingomyelin phosphodiesterase 5-like [Sceloporus undulatus]
MGLRESPYASRFLGGMNTVVRGILFPSYWLLNQLLALQRTTAEKQAQRNKRCPPYTLRALAKGLVILPAFLLSAPISFLAFLVWLPLQAGRRPFAYQHTSGQSPPEEWPLPEGQSRAFGFLSSNVCLLPEGLAKFSNLGQTQWRAKHIAQGLAQATRHSSLSCEPIPRNAFGIPDGQKYGAMGSSPPRTCRSPSGDDPSSVTIQIPLDDTLGEITCRFPAGADFVCLQEVFDLQAANSLRQRLGSCYEHILYDVGTYGLMGCSALKLFNSGLFLASRYPILAAQYNCYPNGKGEDAFAAKGLLCAQVHLGSSQGKRVVGYLNCTHMHAPDADAPVRYDQMTLAMLWAQQFQDTYAQLGDVVAFDIFCGDLNFDNCSSGDELEQSHEIFSIYTDPCRVGPRKDKPWAIGTLLDYMEIYDEAVSTPESMKRTLEQPEGRRKFLAGPVLANGKLDPSATGSEGRRLDYILYREHPGPLALKTAVEKVSFITQLATCSDHLPFGLRLHVTSIMAHPEV